LAESRGDDKTRTRAPDDRRGAVARSAVDDDVLDRVVRLRVDARQRSTDETLGVERRRDDRD
jgi:hypothetical protein